MSGRQRSAVHIAGGGLINSHQIQSLGVVLRRAVLMGFVGLAIWMLIVLITQGSQG